MATSRAESRRPRSNTAQSLLRPPPTTYPLQFGDSKTLNSWVHEVKDSPDVVFNQSWWPGVVQGDALRVTCNNSKDGFLFIVPKDDDSKPQRQISIPKPIADTFDIRNNSEVSVEKVDKDACSADFVELVFQDQYLGRNEMWRLSDGLVGQCVYSDQEISFLGSIAATIQSIYIGGKKVSSAYMTSSTKTIFRSLSAKVTIFIQVCSELWEFAGDGERYNEKIVHSFLPALFARWRDAGTNHTVTIVLISRVFYDETEIDYAAGPLLRDDDGHWFKDFYKVITDLEVIHDWKPTLVSLKNSFWDFQRDILLTHHYHRATLEPTGVAGTEHVRLVGRISFAHDGPILEALNLGLDPTENHYIDRSLSLTGSSTIVITPGTGYFRVSKQLLRMTTTRMLDQGFGLDLISLTKPPLHQTPIFSFQGLEPELRLDRESKRGPRAMDPLWGGDDDPSEWEKREKTTFWWEPFWIAISFWDKQMDLPFREDRFVARAKMHEIQMLGLLELDVISSIVVPFLPEHDPLATPRDEHTQNDGPTRSQTDQFDMDVFTLPREGRPSVFARSSYGSVGSETVMASSYRSSVEKRSAPSLRSSHRISKIEPIQESPRHILRDLPSEGPSHVDHLFPDARSSMLSTSPSQSSVRSSQSARSTSTASSKAGQTSSNLSSTASRTSITSKLASSWLFGGFRSGPSQPQTSTTTVSAVPKNPPVQSAPIRMQPGAAKTTTQATTSRSPKAVTIKHSTSTSSALGRQFDEDGLTPRRSSYPKHSPLNTPPRDEPNFGKRRSTVSSNLTLPLASQSPGSRSNPSRPHESVPYTQASLARRWQHLFPQPMYKHEIKWKSIVTPGCLPLTIETFPSRAELESSYEMSSYDFVVEPPVHSLFVKAPPLSNDVDEQRRQWALVIMREMAAVRLAQGFQFVLSSRKPDMLEPKPFLRPTSSFLDDDDLTPKPQGSAEVLQTITEPVYLSMSNEIHCISYTGEAIQVRRFVRKMPPAKPFEYQCLIWPKLGVGYTELKTSFSARGLENYGWNRLDMLVAGYEHEFSESIRYWRTRFIVIPTAEAPPSMTGPSGETLNEEETRLLGIDKLADTFSRIRWHPPDEKANPVPPVRFLPTTLGPTFAVLDEAILAQLDDIHATGPLRKKMKSEREIGGMSLAAVAKAMREEDGLPIKNNRWHGTMYTDSFTGFDFVSWLVREFRDVSSRAQGSEWGVKLMDQGLFEHCRGQHGFMDGHYFYRLRGEYAVPSTPRLWFRRHQTSVEETPPKVGHYPGTSRPSISSPRKTRKRLILSQSMIVDIDSNKRSDQAERVILHHDIIHNPATVFHFELQWIGTTAKLIDDQLRQWNLTLEKYGLKLVEAYVDQIRDIRSHNAFQSCFPLKLALPPPVVPDLERRVPYGTQTAHYFESALLRRMGFVLDVVAGSHYPSSVDVVYSYRRSAVQYSQFVHRSGVAFVQVLGGAQGLLFLTNRLMGPGRMGALKGNLKSKELRPAKIAEKIRVELHRLCSDSRALEKIYDEEVDALGTAMEDPPPLSI